MQGSECASLYAWGARGTPDRAALIGWRGAGMRLWTWTAGGARRKVCAWLSGGCFAPSLWRDLETLARVFSLPPAASRPLRPPSPEVISWSQLAGAGLWSGVDARSSTL